MKQSFVWLLPLIILEACSPLAKQEVGHAVAMRDGTPVSITRDIQRISELGDVLKQLNGQSILVVLDIDDTLLTSDQFFGSDSWYEWEKSLASNNPAKPVCLFEVIAMNFEVGTQHPVEGKQEVDFINSLNAPLLLLTSRSSNYRGATERELRLNGYRLPHDLRTAGDGLIWTGVQGTRSAPVSYANGIEMVTGLDKGTSLLDLLDRIGQHYDNVILVDDGEANILSLQNAMATRGIHYFGLHYTVVPKKYVNNQIVISATDQAAALQGWQDWKDFLGRRYPSRSARWANISDPKSCAP